MFPAQVAVSERGLSMGTLPNEHALEAFVRKDGTHYVQISSDLLDCSGSIDLATSRVCDVSLGPPTDEALHCTLLDTLARFLPAASSLRKHDDLVSLEPSSRRSILGLRGCFVAGAPGPRKRTSVPARRRDQPLMLRLFNGKLTPSFLNSSLMCRRSPTASRTSTVRSIPNAGILQFSGARRASVAIQHSQ